MDRRKFLLGVGSAAAGGSALIGSGAFSQVDAQRSVTIQVAEDPNAYLGLKPMGTSNSMNYVALDGDGHIQIDISDGGLRDGHEAHADHGLGVNSDSITWFDGMFQICNQGKQDACVSYELPDTVLENSVDAQTVTFYYVERDSDGEVTNRRMIDSGESLPLELGECAEIGVRTVTVGIDANDGPLVDDDVVVTADVNGDCFGGGIGCVDPNVMTWSLDPDTDSDAGGPVILMGIDKEDGGVAGHGPISTYVDVVEDILTEASIGGSGILVIGGENDGGNGDVTEFWDEIESQTGETVTYVRGASNIQSQSFGSYAMLGIVDSYPETGDGMSQSENDALAARSDDIATFVNNGGGLLGGTQSDFDNPWAYISDIGDFTIQFPPQYDDVTPTTAGNDIGIQDPDLDICCWHDVFTDWPDFLEVLAWRAGFEDTEAAALGGASVTLPVAVDIAITGPEKVEVGSTESYDLTVSNEGDALEEEDVEIEVDGGTLVASPGQFTLTSGYQNSWPDGLEVTCDAQGTKDVTVRLVGVNSGDTIAELTAQIDCVSEDPGVCE